MSAMVSQITSLNIFYSTVYSGADERKHLSSSSLAFVRGIHRWPVDSRHKGSVTPKNVSIYWRHQDAFCLGPSDVYSDYWVLSTDYDNYAVVYICRDDRSETDACRVVDTQVIGRHTSLTPEQLAAVNETISDACVVVTAYDFMQHDRGIYYMEWACNNAEFYVYFYISEKIFIYQYII